MENFVGKYNRLASLLNLIPATAANAGGVDFSMSSLMTDSESRRYTTIIKVPIDSVIIMTFIRSTRLKVCKNLKKISYVRISTCVRVCFSQHCTQYSSASLNSAAIWRATWRVSERRWSSLTRWRPTCLSRWQCSPTRLLSSMARSIDSKR